MGLDKLALLLALSGDKNYSKEQIDNLLALKASLDNEGKVPIAELPNAVIERMITVPDDEARFSLTLEQVQLGDTVRVVDSNIMYMVIDETNLNNENGYQSYSAGTAAKAIADQLGNTIDATYAKAVPLSQSEYDALTNKKTDTYYFIYED